MDRHFLPCDDVASVVIVSIFVIVECSVVDIEELLTLTRLALWMGRGLLLSCEYGQSVDGQHWCEVVLFCALCSCGQSRCWVLNGKADSSVCELMGYSSCWPVGGDLATLHPHRRL